MSSESYTPGTTEDPPLLNGLLRSYRTTRQVAEETQIPADGSRVPAEWGPAFSTHYVVSGGLVPSKAQRTMWIQHVPPPKSFAQQDLDNWQDNDGKSMTRTYVMLRTAYYGNPAADPPTTYAQYRDTVPTVGTADPIFSQYVFIGESALTLGGGLDTLFVAVRRDFEVPFTVSQAYDPDLERIVITRRRAVPKGSVTASQSPGRTVEVEPFSSFTDYKVTTEIAGFKGPEGNTPPAYPLELKTQPGSSNYNFPDWLRAVDIQIAWAIARSAAAADSYSEDYKFTFDIVKPLDGPYPTKDYRWLTSDPELFHDQYPLVKYQTRRESPGIVRAWYSASNKGNSTFAQAAELVIPPSIHGDIKIGTKKNGDAVGLITDELPATPGFYTLALADYVTTDVKSRPTKLGLYEVTVTKMKVTGIYDTVSSGNTSGIGNTVDPLPENATATGGDTISNPTENGDELPTGVAQKISLTSASLIESGATQIVTKVTGVRIENSPITVVTAVTSSDTPTVWLGKVAASYRSTPEIAKHWRIGSDFRQVTLESLVILDHDPTMDIEVISGLETQPEYETLTHGERYPAPVTGNSDLINPPTILFFPPDDSSHVYGNTSPNKVVTLLIGNNGDYHQQQTISNATGDYEFVLRTALPTQGVNTDVLVRVGDATAFQESMTLWSFNNTKGGVPDFITLVTDTLPLYPQILKEAWLDPNLVTYRIRSEPRNKLDLVIQRFAIYKIDVVLIATAEHLYQGGTVTVKFTGVTKYVNLDPTAEEIANPFLTRPTDLSLAERQITLTINIEGVYEDTATTLADKIRVAAREKFSESTYSNGWRFLIGGSGTQILVTGGFQGFQGENLTVSIEAAPTLGVLASTSSYLVEPFKRTETVITTAEGMGQFTLESPMTRDLHISLASGSNENYRAELQAEGRMIYATNDTYGAGNWDNGVYANIPAASLRTELAPYVAFTPNVGDRAIVRGMAGQTVHGPDGNSIAIETTGINYTLIFNRPGGRAPRVYRNDELLEFWATKPILATETQLAYTARSISVFRKSKGKRPTPTTAGYSYGRRITLEGTVTEPTASKSSHANIYGPIYNVAGDRALRDTVQLTVVSSSGGNTTSKFTYFYYENNGPTDPNQQLGSIGSLGQGVNVGNSIYSDVVAKTVPVGTAPTRNITLNPYLSASSTINGQVTDGQPWVEIEMDGERVAMVPVDTATGKFTHNMPSQHFSGEVFRITSAPSDGPRIAGDDYGLPTYLQRPVVVLPAPEVRYLDLDLQIGQGKFVVYRGYKYWAMSSGLQPRYFLFTIKNYYADTVKFIVSYPENLNKPNEEFTKIQRNGDGNGTVFAEKKDWPQLILDGGVKGESIPPTKVIVQAIDTKTGMKSPKVLWESRRNGPVYEYLKPYWIVKDGKIIHQPLEILKS